MAQRAVALRGRTILRRVPAVAGDPRSAVRGVRADRRGAGRRSAHRGRRIGRGPLSRASRPRRAACVRARRHGRLRVRHDPPLHERRRARVVRGALRRDALSRRVVRRRRARRRSRAGRCAVRARDTRAPPGRGGVSASRLSRRAPFEDRLPARARAGRRRWPSLRRHLRGIRPSPLGHAARRRIRATYGGRRVLQPRALLARLFAPTALRDLSRATRPRRGNALLPASTVHRHEPLPHDPGAPLDLRRRSPDAAGCGHRRDRGRGSARAPPRPLPWNGRLPAVRLPLQHRCAALPHRARGRRRWPPAGSLAAMAQHSLSRGHRPLVRDEHLRDHRDHEVRLLAMTEDIGRAERRSKLLVAGAIALGVVLRLAVVRAQGFPTDVGTYQAWAERLASIGPGRFYEPGYFCDYPPGFLYVLWLLGALFDGEPLRLAVKALSIPADIAIALLVARLLWRTAGRAAAVAAAAIWSLQPGPIFAGPYLGQVDAVGTVAHLGGLLAAGVRTRVAACALGGVRGR